MVQQPRHLSGRASRDELALLGAERQRRIRAARFQLRRDPRQPPRTGPAALYSILLSASASPAAPAKGAAERLLLQSRTARCCRIEHMAASFAKQKRERSLIENAREQSRVFPPGELEMADRPDGRIPAAKLGIEVCELLPERPDGAIFSGPQLSSFQSEVAIRAARLFSVADIRPSAVLVFFNNDWCRKRNLDEMAEALATFVANNYPQQTKTVCLQRGPRAVGWVDGLSVVRIAAEEGRWQAGGFGPGVTLTYERLASQIARKNELVQQYQKQLPGWQIWLLLVTHISVLRSVSVPREINKWRFKCDFDRVFLSSWEDGVLQLNCSKESAKSDQV